MSGTAPGMENVHEPNLTPLLDMVLQLVMFFMLVANFVVEQTNETIKLPDAIAAKAMDAKTDRYIILNLTQDGTVQISGVRLETLKGLSEIKDAMKNRFDIDRRVASKKDWEEGKGRSIIILRADKESRYKEVDEVLQAIRSAGYENIHLRALKK